MSGSSQSTSSSSWSRTSKLPLPIGRSRTSSENSSINRSGTTTRSASSAGSSTAMLGATSGGAGLDTSNNRIKRQRSALPRPTTWFNSPTKSQHKNVAPSRRSLDSEGDDDFVMVSVSPNGKPSMNSSAVPAARGAAAATSFACGMAAAAQRLSLMEADDPDDLDIDDSPIRIPAGQSRSLGPAGRNGPVMGRRRSTSERDSPEAARRFTSASVVSGGDVMSGNGVVSDLTRSWMKRSRADVSPLHKQLHRAGDCTSSPPPPDTPIHQGTASHSTGLLLSRPPPQPVFPSLRASHSHSRSGDGQPSVFLSPYPNKTMATNSGRSRTMMSVETKENNIFSAKKSVSFEGLGKTAKLDDASDTFTFGLGSGLERNRRTAFGTSSQHANVDRGALSRSSASPFSTHTASPFVSASVTDTQHSSHRRANSNDHGRLGRYSTGGSAISRSHGLKSGLAQSALSTGPSMPKSISNDSHSSLLSHATSSSTILTVPDTHLFDDVKPLQAAFEASEGPVARKFKPRDSGVSLGDPVAPSPVLHPPASCAPLKGDKDGRQLGHGHLGLQPRPNGSLTVKPVRPQMLKRASSCGVERQSPVETPGLMPVAGSAWPTVFGVDFHAAAVTGLVGGDKDGKPSMPDTPVKRGAFSLGGATSGTFAGLESKSYSGTVGHSISQPALASATMLSAVKPPVPTNKSAFDSSRKPPPPPKPSFSLVSPSGDRSLEVDAPSSSSPIGSSPSKSAGPPLTLRNTESSGATAMAGESEQLSPTVHLGAGSKGSMYAHLHSGSAANTNVRMGLLRRLSGGGVSGSSEASEGEDTPTKRGLHGIGMLAAGTESTISPTPSPRLACESLPVPKTENRTALAISTSREVVAISTSEGSPLLAPRLSLPQFTLAKPSKRLHHRQSAPDYAPMQEDDIFDKRFVIVEPLGKGAFSQVVKVKERDGEGMFAVKKARGVFDGVKDRLRHLEEVDILRHLCSKPHPHVITFIDAWEQNRQLYIQTELCLGSLAFFLEEYGKLVERLDEGRAWKIARELADGVEYIHGMGVIHFDLKPANILITATGGLKIGDFGLASRWPRISPTAVLAGSGLGGDVGSGNAEVTKMTDREGDRVYMPPEMLRGHYSMAADIFSYGLMILEVATNICVPDGGAPWHALRQNDFSVVDFAPLSPALTDLITSCMRADPAERPPIATIAHHPVIARARARGKDALVPEDERFLPDVLAGDMILPASPANDGPHDADVDMDGV